MDETTTIVVEKTTHERLMKVGNKRQTFDDIINELLDSQGG